MRNGCRDKDMVNKKSRNRLRLQQIIFVVLFLVLLTAVAMLSQRHSAQFDWTSSKRNTLSDSSIKLLNTLDSPVNVSVFVQDGDTTSAAIKEILNRYQRQKADFHYQLINPDLDIVQAQAENIDQYGQIVINYKDQREVVNSLSEKVITSALIRMSRDGQRLAVFLTGHGEKSIESDKNYGLMKFAVQLRNKGYELTNVNLLRDKFPENIAMLVIASPENKVLPGESEQITNYVLNGGNLLWLQDPGKNHDLKTLADILNIQFVPGIIIDDNSNLRATLRIQHPAIIPVLEYIAHPISKNLQYNTIFPISGGLTHLPQQDDMPRWQSTHVLRSLPRSWSETGKLGKEVEFSTSDGDTAGPITLGIAMNRVLDQSEDKKEDHGKDLHLLTHSLCF